MNARRESRLAVVEGVTSGSFLWSVSATLGLGAIMVAHVWVFAMVRYLGAGYLLYLTLKSARAALRPNQLDARDIGLGNALGAYSKGLAIYLTNPKAILFFGSLYSIGVPHDASMGDLAIVIGAVAIMSFLIFHGIALLFSSRKVMDAYLRLRRWFEGVFVLALGAAGLKVLTARVD
jgi:threonine efflux protein